MIRPKYASGVQVLMSGLLLSLVSMSCQSKHDLGPENNPQSELEELKKSVLEGEEIRPQTVMQRDLRRICDGETLSGALELPLGDRAMHTGIWLASNIESQEARDLSASLRVLDVSGKIARLQDEVLVHSLSGCDLVLRWQDFAKRQRGSQ